MRKVIRVGLDFDGVVTYHPMRVARVLIAFIKHKILKIKKLGFFVPQNKWQKMLFRIVVVWPSVLPANGVKLLKLMSKSSKYEFYLVTGRFGFVKDDTYQWLKRWGLSKTFKNVCINEKNDQPHNFKLKMCQKFKFDYYIEDNWDIVNSLNGKTRTKLFWIYNILDRGRKYSFKFPYLKLALEQIKRDENII
ncbi:hypothetical protein A2397_02850 [Candidatus Amesbacteria bacterium RIFOXYB1_FULL_44_23]|uniref:Nucleotidase n=1 Tax=Candidatus Amesbacteria bacterium RIFOXYB1_FULL_44_23 TaxID=1797263 RepID=A0A1F4ZSY7_9BACT|nr:MAG: hypothetical protein A2397_02850 [Candidatus Amesbacteria bacterium RIFOXYB1_FULL_44_23]